MMETSSQRIRL